MASSPPPRPDADDTDGSARNDTPFSTRPLGRTGSRLLVVLALLLALGTSIGSAYFLIHVAEEADAAAPDTTQSPGDVGAPNPDGLNAGS